MNKIVPPDAVLIPNNAEQVFHGVLFDVYQWRQKLFDGTQTTFEMLRRPDTVTVAGIVNDKIITLRDEQPGDRVKFAFPGGRAMPGEDTLETAQREMREETGLEFSHWRLVFATQPFSKIEWFVYLYIAWEPVNNGKQQLDAGERNTIILCDLDEIRSLAEKKPKYFEGTAGLFTSLTSISMLEEIPEYIGKEVPLTAS